MSVTLLKIAAVSSQGPYLDSSGQAEKVVFPEKSGEDVGFHDKSQGKFVLINEKSGNFFQTVCINPDLCKLECMISFKHWNL